MIGGPESFHLFESRFEQFSVIFILFNFLKWKKKIERMQKNGLCHFFNHSGGLTTFSKGTNPSFLGFPYKKRG